MITSLSDRESYPCLEKFTYLNQASLGLISSECIKEMTNFLNQTARFGNIHISDEDELDIVDKLRITASKLLRCPSNQTAVLSSASEILNQIPYIIKPSKKSEILLLKNDFPAVTRPWLKYAKDQSCSINFIEENLKSDITDEVLKNITSKTSVIAISLIQYSTGTKINLDILSKEAKSKGIKLVIDVTQALGAIPIFADKWDADFLVSSGYKWLGGHGGVGLAYVSKYSLKSDPFNAGWMGAPNPFNMIYDKCDYSRDSKSYTQSTMSYVSIIGLKKSIEELIKLNPFKIEKHSKKLSKFLISRINQKKWKVSQNNKTFNNSNHIISFQSKSNILEPSIILKRLKKNKIICSLRNKKIRLSIAHFNNQKDIENLLETLN